MFHQSVKSVSAAVYEIADSFGASGDPEMQTRAFRSLQASLEDLNNRASWDFTLIENAPITIVPLIVLTGISAITVSANTNSFTVSAGHGLLPWDMIVGAAPFPLGTRVSATAVNGVTATTIATASIGPGSITANQTFVRDCYDLPSDYKSMYSIRLYNTQSTLRPMRRRFYDRSVVDELSQTSPVGYDVFLTDMLGKVRLLPPPAASDQMQIKYYRRIAIPTASAATEALDLLQDYEPYMIAWGKWHAITDKGEGRMDQAQVWLSYAEKGYKTMLSNQVRLPDEDLMFEPGAYTYNPAWGPNSVRGILDWTW